MSSEIAIEVVNLSKCYQIYEQPSDRLRQFIYPRGRRILGLEEEKYYREFWALKDISFEVKKGETVGIIGQNGSGKSTLLQIICGTLNQTHGTVQKNGRVAALLELGSGFNPEFTGRENIYLSSSLLGLSNIQIEESLRDVISFADIGDFIDQPVKTYSSGMFVRLAFSVNIMAAPDIMIVDEALAVGDMNFQAKCMTALKRLQNNGTAILFVSHDVSAVKSLCSKAIYLNNGFLISSGNAPEIAEFYIRNMREKLNSQASVSSKENTNSPIDIHEISCSSNVKIRSNVVFKKSNKFDSEVAFHRYGTGGGKITYVELLNLESCPINSVEFDQEVKIVIYIQALSEKNISVGFCILDEKKINLVGCGFPQVDFELLNTVSGQCYRVQYTLRLPLAEGSYSIRALISSPIIPSVSAEFMDVVEDAIVFKVNRWTKSTIWSKVHLYPTLEVELLDPKSE